jgi:hypothetical protein
MRFSPLFAAITGARMGFSGPEDPEHLKVCACIQKQIGLISYQY